MEPHSQPTAWAALFAGQLSEQVGMGAELLASSAAARELFSHAETIHGVPLTRIMAEGPIDLLLRDDVAQPAVFVLGCAIWNELARRRVPPPSAVAGYSLGNYAALVAAGALSFDDAFFVLRRVLDLVAEHQVRGAMAAVVGMTETKVGELCEGLRETYGWIEPANLNAEHQIVVAGTEAAVDAFVAAAQPQTLRAIRLPMALPIHSQLMAPVADRLRSELPGRITLRAPTIPFYATSFGRRVESANEVLDLLIHQVVRPSLWSRTIRAMIADGHRRFREVGSGEVLTKILRWIDRAADCRPLATPAHFAELAVTPTSPALR